jgi:hypothetical protein
MILLMPYNRGMEQAKKSKGRPPIDQADKLVQISIHVKASTAKLIQEYGRAWAREALENAPPPPDKRKI